VKNEYLAREQMALGKIKGVCLFIGASHVKISMCSLVQIYVCLLSLDVSLLHSSACMF
jgi:hypothetical protein